MALGKSSAITNILIPWHCFFLIRFIDQTLRNITRIRLIDEEYPKTGLTVVTMAIHSMK